MQVYFVALIVNAALCLVAYGVVFGMQTRRWRFFFVVLNVKFCAGGDAVYCIDKEVIGVVINAFEDISCPWYTSLNEKKRW